MRHLHGQPPARSAAAVQVQPINEGNVNKPGHMSSNSSRGAEGQGRGQGGGKRYAPINYFLCPDLRSPSSLNVVINQVFSRDKCPTGDLRSGEGRLERRAEGAGAGDRNLAGCLCVPRAEPAHSTAAADQQVPLGLFKRNYLDRLYRRTLGN